MITVFLAAASVMAQYDCALDKPEEFKRENGIVEARMINLSQFQKESDWKFEIKVEKSKENPIATVRWPSNPMQLSGQYPLLATGTGAFAFATYSAGPCLFTEQMCMSLVHVVDQPDGSADIIISPSAMSTDLKRKVRYPFIVIAQGKCTRTGATK